MRSPTVDDAAKVPTKVVSEGLGDANVGITPSVDANVTAQDDQCAAEALGEV